MLRISLPRGGKTTVGGEMLEKIDKAIEQTLYYISGLLLFAIACMVFYAVTLRYVFNEPPLWADEAPRAFSCG